MDTFGTIFSAALTVLAWNSPPESPPLSVIESSLGAIAVFDGGPQPSLIFGGTFNRAGPTPVNYLARWDGAGWFDVGGGLNGPPHSFYVNQDSNGAPQLLVAGQFSMAGGVSAFRVARWNGWSWAPIGAGFDDRVYTITEFDDGTGPALYAGGNFWRSGNVDALYVARWDGSAWQALPDGPIYVVRTMAVFDDGSGTKLYVGGEFGGLANQPAAFIARWDGQEWSPVGAGLSGPVYAMTVYDAGNGPALYAAGDGDVVRWDGQTWTVVGSPQNGAVLALAGGAGGLFAGGRFTEVDGVPAMHVARWDGTTWHPLGDGMNAPVFGLAEWNDGPGPAMFATGWFTAAGGMPAPRAARWDGQQWSGVGSGLRHPNDPPEPEPPAPNNPPLCNTGGPYTVECGTDDVSVALDGSSSSDPDGDELVFEWWSDDPDVTFDDPASPTTTLHVVPGLACVEQRPVYLTVGDGRDSATCSTQVVTRDTGRPVLSGVPPPITVTDADCSGDESVELPMPEAFDLCDPNPQVTDDRPVVFPAGATTPVTFTARDACGNETYVVVDVTVLGGAATVEVEVTAVKKHRKCKKKRSTPDDSDATMEVFAFSYDDLEATPERRSKHKHKHEHKHKHKYHGSKRDDPYADLLAEAEPVGQCTVDADGACQMQLPPGRYVFVAPVDRNEDGDADDYLHADVFAECGDTTSVRLE